MRAWKETLTLTAALVLAVFACACWLAGLWGAAVVLTGAMTTLLLLVDEN